MEKSNNFIDEINFRNIFKKPIKLFGWYFPLYFILLLILGIYFAQHLNQISFNEVNAGIVDSTNIKKEIIERKGGVIPAVNFDKIKNPAKEIISKGKELYDLNCKSCHGDNGFGDGPAGARLNPKPRNFHQQDGWKNGRTIDAMYKTLQKGIVQSGMPAYDFLSPQDKFSLILYIRTFTNFPEITDAQLENLDKEYNLSTGSITPNQIPVGKAESILMKENNSLLEKVEQLKKRLTISNESGARLLIKYADNIDKVLYSFSRLNEKSLNNFISVVSMNPINLGYKPTVIGISVNEWESIYEYLYKNLANI